MDKRASDLTIHARLELIIKDMIEKGINLKDALHETEKIFYEQAARRCDGNRTKMAETLGVHRNTLNNRAKVLKIKAKF